MATRRIIALFAIALSALSLSGCGTTLHILEPKEGIVYYNTFPTFKWEVLPQASGYQIQVALDENFQKIVLDRSGIVQESFRTPQELQFFSTKLYWRVRPLVKGKLKDWSPPLSFEISPLKPPELRQPVGEIKELQPVFQWEKVQEAKSYHLQLSTNKEFSNILWEQPNCGETKSQLAQLRLKYDTSHYWRVRAVAEDAGVGPWSGAQQFLIPFTSPQAREPSGSMGFLTLSFTWTGSPIALSHEVQVSRDPAFGQLDIDELVEGTRYDPPAHKLG
ncbi:MAG: hypothetical protein V1878_07180 [bacterium]